jgi:hypothetical protein
MEIILGFKKIYNKKSQRKLWCIHWICVRQYRVQRRTLVTAAVSLLLKIRKCVSKFTCFYIKTSEIGFEFN